MIELYIKKISVEMHGFTLCRFASAQDEVYDNLDKERYPILIQLATA